MIRIKRRNRFDPFTCSSIVEHPNLQQFVEEEKQHFSNWIVSRTGCLYQTMNAPVRFERLKKVLVPTVSPTSLTIWKRTEGWKKSGATPFASPVVPFLTEARVPSLSLNFWSLWNTGRGEGRGRLWMFNSQVVVCLRRFANPKMFSLPRFHISVTNLMFVAICNPTSKAGRKFFN